MRTRMLNGTVLSAPDFASSKTYVYKYEAVLMAGLPEEGLASAGLKVLSKVLISNIAENTYLLKVNIPLRQPPKCNFPQAAKPESTIDLFNYDLISLLACRS